MTDRANPEMQTFSVPSRRAIAEADIACDEALAQRWQTGLRRRVGVVAHEALAHAARGGRKLTAPSEVGVSGSAGMA